ncbi:MAG: hypothetical protein ABFR33_10870, partial [Verrucomicrobiota bacterium]
MSKKLAYVIIAMGITVSAATVFAADEAAAKTDGKTIAERVEALEKGAKKSDWTDKIKVKGDIRARFEHREKDGATDKSRFRGRA